MDLLSGPATLWDLYVTYLWNAQPGSWVSASASTFRILAFIVIIPCALLMLLVSTPLTLAPPHPDPHLTPRRMSPPT